MALGARPADVHRLVLRETMRPVAGGLIAGTIVSLLLGRAVKGLLFHVPAVQPAVLALVIGTLVAIAMFAACWAPARRAAAAGPGGAAARLHQRGDLGLGAALKVGRCGVPEMKKGVLVGTPFK